MVDTCAPSPKATTRRAIEVRPEYSMECSIDLVRFCSRNANAREDHEKTTAADALRGVRERRVVSEHAGKSKPSNGIHAPLVCTA